MHKSLLDYAKEYLETVKKPQTIDTIFENVRKLSGYTEEEFSNKKAQFYSDFTLCSNFIFCGNGWDLKVRQPEALFDCDSSFFVDPKERKKIIEKRKLEKKSKEVEFVNEDSISGYEGVDEYVETDIDDDDYDDQDYESTYGDDYSSNDDDYDDDDEDDDEDYDNLINKYEDLYDEE